MALYPDLTTWQSFTRDEIAEVIDEHRTNIIDKIMQLTDIAAGVPSSSAATQVSLADSLLASGGGASEAGKSRSRA